MKIEDRIIEVEKILDGSSSDSEVKLSFETVQVLLKYTKDRMKVKYDYLQMSNRAKYYEEAYNYAKAELKRRKVQNDHKSDKVI